jgi:NAD-dependent DNA ligase
MFGGAVMEERPPPDAGSKVRQLSTLCDQLTQRFGRLRNSQGGLATNFGGCCVGCRHRMVEPWSSCLACQGLVTLLPGACAELLSPHSQDVVRGHPDAFTGKTFVFSGVLSSLYRDVAKDLVLSHGGRVTGGALRAPQVS